MPPLLTTTATILCPHGGTVIAQSAAPAKAGQAPVLRTADTFTVAGCAFSTPATGPHPCVTVAWTQPAAAVTVAGDRPLTTASIGLCKAADQAVQGVAIVSPAQVRAAAR